MITGTAGPPTGGPLACLDRAFTLVRSGRGIAWGAVRGALPLWWVAILIYYLERIEGVRGARSGCALLLVLALVYRGLVLGDAAAGLVVRLRPELGRADRSPGAPVGQTTLGARMRTVVVVTFGIGVWGALALWLAQASPYLVMGLAPLFAIRGSVAPAWPGHVACGARHGMPGFLDAVDDNRGVRTEMYMVELLLLCGVLGMYVNLYGLLQVSLSLAESLLGVEVSLWSSFSSADGGLMLVLLGGASAVLTEPLRAAVGATAYVDARSRRDGADLEVLVAAALVDRRGRRQQSRAVPLAGVLVLAAALATGGVARAQMPTGAAGESSDTPDAQGLNGRDAVADGRVREQVRRILARPAFREFADHDGATLGGRLSDWLERMMSDLDRAAGDRRSQAQNSPLPAPPAWLLVLLGVLVAGVIAWLWVSGGQPAAVGDAVTAGARAAGSGSPQEMVGPDELAARGEYRLAVRAHYLATLVALDRARLLSFEPAATNWHHLRQLPAGELREVFAELTRLFDRAWYGGEATRQPQYAAARELCAKVMALSRAGQASGELARQARVIAGGAP